MKEKAQKTQSDNSDVRLINIDIELIVPNQFQPRLNFQRESLMELADSILAGGIIQPLVVRQKRKKYELVSGERRLQAAKLAKLKVVPAIVRKIKNRQMLEMALVENLQREDLNAMEESYAIRKLIEDFKLSHENVAKTIGRSRSYVSHVLRLLKLPVYVQKLVRKGTLSAGHAKVLVSVEDKGDLKYLVGLIQRRNLSVRQLEKAARRKPIQVTRDTAELLPSRFIKVQDKLMKTLGIPVEFRQVNKDGMLILQYKDTDELNELLSEISGKSLP